MLIDLKICVGLGWAAGSRVVEQSLPVVSTDEEPACFCNNNCSALKPKLLSDFRYQNLIDEDCDSKSDLAAYVTYYIYKWGVC